MGKGAKFEREISKALSKWWTEGQRDDVFWRTSQSGGRATIRKKQGKNTKNQDGDICATDPIGQPLLDIATIELKVGYNSWNIKEIIDSVMRTKNSKLEDFFEQCQREANAQNKKCWCLITRQDRREPLIFINNEFWRFLKSKKDFSIEIPSKIIIVHPKFGYIQAMRLGDFFYRVSPELFYEKS